MFTVGQFSNLTRVSKRLLRYYDEIGLFKPSYIDPSTGRRYYSTKQMPTLNRILALKDLGLSLAQITQMQHISDDEIHGMLMLRKAEIEQTIQGELQRLRMVEARLQQNKSTDNMPDVVIKSIPAQPLLSLRTVFSSPEGIMRLVAQMLDVVPKHIDRNILGHMMGVFYADGHDLTNQDVDLGFLLNQPIDTPVQLSDKHALHIGELPAVETMATSVQTLDTGPDPVYIGFGEIARWIEENGYRIIGPYREIIFDVNSISDFEHAIIEIQMPVAKE